MVIALISIYAIENNGIRSIAAMLRTNGFRVIEIYFKDWVNNLFIPPSEVEIQHLLDILKSHKVEIAGISINASGYHDVAAMLTGKIQNFLEIPVIWGGLHVTLVPEECIQIADMVNIGEGEYPILELANKISHGKDITDIENIWVRQHNRITRKDIRPPVADLDDLPFRDFHSKDKYFVSGKNVEKGDPFVNSPMFQIYASLGCPFSTCSFCGNTIVKQIYKTKGNFYRRRKVSSVIVELLYAKQHFKNLRIVRFDDGVFIPDIEWIDEFSREYKDKIQIPFACMIDPRVVTKDWLLKLKDAGLCEAFMGIQNIEKINSILYNRNISDKMILDTANLLHELKIKISYHLVFDDPISTSEDKRELFEMMLKIKRPYNIIVFSMTVFPKSVLAEKLMKLNLIRENEIEGKAHKIFSQWKVDLNYPRSSEDTFWISIYFLLSKRFLPKRFIKKMSMNKFLFLHPHYLLYFASTMNFLKLLLLLIRMILTRKVNLIILKKWLTNRKSLVST